MANKVNNKTLILVLAALAGIYFLSQFFQNRSRQKTALKTDIIAIDTSAISELKIKGQDEVTFKREGSSWTITSNGITDQADINSVNSILIQLLGIKADRLVATSSDKWSEYQLTDSTATRVSIKEGAKESLDLYVGRFQYRPPAGGQQNQFQQRQPQITGSTYLRLGEGDEVYATEGFLAMTFSQGFNTWRQGEFVKAVKSNIRQVQFDYPTDSSFVLSQVDSLWTINGVDIDQAKADQYLNRLVYKQDKNFVDNFNPAGPVTHTLTISGDNMENIIVKAYADYENDRFHLQSTLNPNATIESKKVGLFSQLFESQAYFNEN